MHVNYMWLCLPNSFTNWLSGFSTSCSYHLLFPCTLENINNIVVLIFHNTAVLVHKRYVLPVHNPNSAECGILTGAVSCVAALRHWMPRV